MTRRGKHGTGPVALQPAPGGAYNPPGRRLQPWLHPFIRREDLPCQAARRHGACRPAHPRFRAMILTCPACSTRYTLDPQSLGPDGRKVRCTQCGHVWHQDPPADMPRSCMRRIPEKAPSCSQRAYISGSPAGPSMSCDQKPKATFDAVAEKYAWYARFDHVSSWRFSCSTRSCLKSGCR